MAVGNEAHISDFSNLNTYKQVVLHRTPTDNPNVCTLEELLFENMPCTCTQPVRVLTSSSGLISAWTRGLWDIPLHGNHLRSLDCCTYLQRSTTSARSLFCGGVQFDIIGALCRALARQKCEHSMRFEILSRTVLFNPLKIKPTPILLNCEGEIPPMAILLTDRTTIL